MIIIELNIGMFVRDANIQSNTRKNEFNIKIQIIL